MNDDKVVICGTIGIGCAVIVLNMAFWLGLIAGACWIVKLFFFS